MKREKSIYIDGMYYAPIEAKISVYDHGLLYGDGVFEGMRIYNNKIVQLDRHIERLYKSAKTLFLEINVPKNEMKDIVINTCIKNHLVDGYIRLIVTRGIGDLGLDPNRCKYSTIICIADELSVYPKDMYEKGISIITSSQRRNKASILDPQIKSLNYLNNILSKIEANRAGVCEALLLDEDGFVTECTGDNIFIVCNAGIYTPPVHVGILNGITRQVVIEIAESHNFKLSEEKFTLYNLYNSQECFLTGTGAEIIPVTQVDDRKIGNGEIGGVTKHIISKFNEYIHSDPSNYQIRQYDE